MRTWDKYRTQYAQPFVQNGQMRIGFLVGSYQSISHYITAKGEQITLHGSIATASVDYVEEITPNAIIRTFPDGTTHTTPKPSL